jgi:hypothetical protein
MTAAQDQAFKVAMNIAISSNQRFVDRPTCNVDKVKEHNQSLLVPQRLEQASGWCENGRAGIARAHPRN